MKIKTHSIESTEYGASNIILTCNFIHNFVQMRLSKIVLADNASCFQSLFQSVILKKLMLTL